MLAIKSEKANLRCPWCGEKVNIELADADGNMINDSYKWSCLKADERCFILTHYYYAGITECPIAKEDGILGENVYSTINQAIKYWNSRSKV